MPVLEFIGTCCFIAPYVNYSLVCMYPEKYRVIKNINLFHSKNIQRLINTW